MWKQIHTIDLQDPNTGHRYLETNIYDIPTRHKFLQVASMWKQIYNTPTRPEYRSPVYAWKQIHTNTYKLNPNTGRQ